MKRSLVVCQLALLALAIGCQGQQSPVADATPATEPTTVQPASSGESGEAVTFVSLKVPNMH